MPPAEQVALTAAIAFFLTGLATGVWKYRHIAKSADARAPVYVDIAHRSSLLYAFASLLLAKLASLSALPDIVDLVAASVALTFFALAVASYIVHGFLRDTDNQLARPHRLGSRVLSGAAMRAFMALLIVGELGGALVLGAGALVTIWGGGT